MKKEKKTRGQLISELAKLRQRIAELEKAKVELERAEEQLRQTKEVFARAEQIGRFGHWYRDFAENKATWSEGTYRIFSGDPEQLDISYEAFLALVHPSDRELLKSAVEAALAEGEGLDTEYRIIRPDGTVRNIHSFAEVRFDKSGKPVGLDGTVHDITERKQAEDVLKQSEQRFRAVLEAVPDLMLILDAEGRYREVFTSDSDLLYAPADQLLDKTIYDVLPPEDAQQIQEIIDRVLAEGEFQKYDYVLKTGGIERSFAGRVTKFRFQNSDCVLWCARDITERKQMEAALGESEERYRGIVETQTELVCRFLPDGTLTFVNDAICKLLGERREELIGKNFYPYIHPDDQQKTRKNLESLSKENPLGTNEERVIMPDGEVHWWQWINQAFFDEQGSLVEFQSVGRDITKRKEAEDALRESEAELAEQSRHLEEVNAALKALLRQRENDKADLEQRLLTNVKELVIPYVEKLKNSRLNSQQMTLLGILESNMKEIVSPFATTLSSRFLNLTPTEIQVASLIKDGKTSKEIAALLNASEHTVRSHRFHIRSKLGIKNKKVNMRSYLKSLHHE
ncbi:MAG: PAS domain S-box protein [Syntrophobacterales bacterium]